MTGHNMKTIKSEFKAKGIYYTPPELAEYLKSLVDVDTNEVYDPTCGDGALLSVFGDDVAKYGQEINEPQLKVAQERLVNFNGFCGDTLANPAWLGKRFKVIVANPPFSIKWQPVVDERFENAPTIPTQSRADYAFILHCLHYLAGDGVAVMLSAMGVLYRGNREGKIRQWLVEQNYIDKVIAIEDDTFVDTPIPTCVLVLRKNKTTTDITFIVRASGEERVVSVDEVRANGFYLGVNRYIEPPETKRKHEDIDMVAHHQEIRADSVKQLGYMIEHDKMICEIESSLKHQDFIDMLQSVIDGQALLV